MKIVSSDGHLAHQPKGELEGGTMVPPYEHPGRIDTINAELDKRGFSDRVPPDPVDLELVGRVHSAAFLDFLATAWSRWAALGHTGDALPITFPARRMQQRLPEHIDGQLAYFAMAIDTAITKGSWEAAQEAAAIAQTAQSLVSGGERTAFALTRPPGHHAARDLYGGYCFLNNAAIAAEGFIRAGVERVAIVDVDFHHGNGTQDIFYERDDVFFVSLHGDPRQAFPHFLGYADETGANAGTGCNLNLPMPPGTTYEEWGPALDQGLDAVRRFGAQALVISLGVDTFERDPISFFKLESDHYLDIGDKIEALGLPTVFVMEGGYAVDEIGTNTVNVLAGFMSGIR